MCREFLSTVIVPSAIYFRNTLELKRGDVLVINLKSFQDGNVAAGQQNGKMHGNKKISNSFLKLPNPSGQLLVVTALI